VTSGHGSAGADPGHAPGGGAAADVRALRIALALIVGFMAVEVVIAFTAHSLALLADAGHMLTDAVALGAALWAISLSARPATATWSYGLKRAEILAAAVNGVSLVVMAGLVTVEAVRRLIRPSEVVGVAVLTVAILGIAVNVVAVVVLSRANRSSLNVEGAFRHITTDAAGFIATAVAAVVILTTGFLRADAVASLVVVGLMLHAGWGLLKSAGRVLLEGTPEGVDLAAIRAQILAADTHVIDVHDLHAWVVTSDLPAVSAHVVVDDSCFSDGHAARILDAVQAGLHSGFDLEHSTLQLEVAAHSAHETGAH
jgi:cobalt-zinc-cadmium efflux system protein